MLCVRVAIAIASAAIASALLAVGSPHVLAEEAIAPCTEAGTPLQTADVAGARDGITLKLVDGREVPLAGVIAPSEIDGDGHASAHASAILDRLTAGKRIALYARDDRKDRYGRLAAQVAFARDHPRWIQAALVSDGVRRVVPEVGEVACAESLMGFERSARAGQKKGLWSEPRFSVVKAQDLAALNAAMGRFSVIEGSVTRVGETADRTYLDFGRRYTEDFTIVIPRQARAAFASAGIDLKSLRGKQVRVRGVLFSSGGPAMEIRMPLSLEILTDRGT